MLNSDREAKAISEFNTFFSSTKTKVANETNATLIRVFCFIYFCLHMLYVFGSQRKIA